LSGHAGPIQKVRYNRDGDLLFSCGKKDKRAMCWYTNTGERLGTYEGHAGSIFDIDIDFRSKRVLTASADRSCKLWELETGEEIFHFALKTTARACGFAEGDKMILALQDESRTNVLDCDSTVFIYNIDEDPSQMNNVPVGKVLKKGGCKMTHAMWGPLNTEIITCDLDGWVRKFDVTTEKEVDAAQEHRDAIKGMQFSQDKTMFLTASTDQTVKLWDTKTMRIMKTYQSDRPLNGCAISPKMNHVIVGGGQDARSVTTTSSRSGKFEVEFYHTVYQDYMGSVKGHFGPVNWVSIGPKGKSYASGGEDGYIRLHHFDAQYFKTKEW